VQITERALTATIMLDDGAGHTFGPRVLHAGSCDELARSVAVVVAMALPAIADVQDRSAVETVIAAAPPAPAESSPPPATVPITTLPTAPPSIARMTEQRDDAIAKEGDLATQPTDRALMIAIGLSSSLGTAIALGLHWRGETYAVEAELGGELAPPVTVMTGAHVDVQRLAATLATCRRVAAFGICALVRAGFDRGSGSGLMDARSAVVPLLELGTRVTWDHPLTDRFVFQLRGEGVVAATSSQFDVDNVAVWHSNRFEALATAGVLVRFP
jgi:hypothetical protein